MNTTRWSGPWCHALTAEGEKLVWEPLTNRTDPTGATKFVVRWRVGPTANARKRTLRDAGAARAFARSIEAARLLELPHHPDGSPADQGGIGSAGATTAVPTPSTGPAPTPAPVTPASPAQPLPVAPVPVAPPGSNALALTVADYIDRLRTSYAPVWAQQGQVGKGTSWWETEMAFLKMSLRYPCDDERITTHSVSPGASIHLALLREADLDRVLHLRRTVDLRVEHQNRQRQEKYERLVSRYEEKQARWEAGSGPRGRKPVPPKPPVVKDSVSADGRPIIKPTTEHGFRTALTFVFDRALDAGHFPPGSSPYRRWNPRGSGGHGSARRGPFRRVVKPTADVRDYPGLGYWIDLGDALAERGATLDGGLRAGERYRILPLTCVQIAPVRERRCGYVPSTFTPGTP